MDPVAFLFPGQGAQALGMAVELVDAYPEARTVFDAGKEVLGRDILEVCRTGPEAELNSTRISQPAIFLHSVAVLRVLDEAMQIPALAVAGLSLGEYSALVCARSVDFADALQIVALRGEYMQEACDSSSGTMASVIGLEVARVEDVVAQARADGLNIGIANYNSPDQTVISGEVGALDLTVKRLEEAGARRAIRLKVAGAYHSPLMAAARQKLRPHLEKLAISAPKVPFYSNVTGAEATSPEQIRENLLLQIENPVRWEQTLRSLLARGIKQALELGPGRVLAGLMRSVSREVEVVQVGTCEQVKSLFRKVQQGQEGKSTV
jgi:[acyl-carrier-protein] S-malonyltransferase